MVSSSPKGWLSHATERHLVSFLSKGEGEGHVRLQTWALGPARCHLYDVVFFKEAVFLTCIRYHSNKKHGELSLTQFITLFHSFEANETLCCSPATIHSYSKHGEMRRLLPHDETSGLIFENRHLQFVVFEVLLLVRI